MINLHWAYGQCPFYPLSKITTQLSLLQRFWYMFNLFNLSLSLFRSLHTHTHTHTHTHMYIYIYICIILIKSSWQCGVSSFPIAIHPYHPSIPASLLGCIMCPHWTDVSLSWSGSCTLTSQRRKVIYVSVLISLPVPCTISSSCYIVIYSDTAIKMHAVRKTQDKFFRKIFTSHFIARFACERMLETEHKLHILTPLLWPSRCVLLSWCWGQLHRGFSEDPLGRVRPSIPHLVSGCLEFYW